MIKNVDLSTKQTDLLNWFVAYLGKDIVLLWDWQAYWFGQTSH